MRRLLPAVLVLTVLDMTGCDSSGINVAPAAATDVAALATASGGHPQAWSTGSQHTSGRGQPDANPGAGSISRPSATASPTAVTLIVTLGVGCVVPGGTQSLTAQSRPGYSVAFNSQYADGKTGATYGGYGVLATNAQGVAHTSWTVAAAAPLGDVKVDVGTGNGGPASVTRRTFTIAANC